MSRKPLETETYKELWLFGDEARAWLAAHKPDPDAYGYDRMMRRHFRAEYAVSDGWGIVVSFHKGRPDDQSTRRAICPKCNHELQLNQRAWMHRHENRCQLPTQVRIGGWLADAGNVFSTPPGTDRFAVYIARGIASAFKKLQEAA